MLGGEVGREGVGVLWIVWGSLFRYCNVGMFFFREWGVFKVGWGFGRGGRGFCVGRGEVEVFVEVISLNEGG